MNKKTLEEARKLIRREDGAKGGRASFEKAGKTDKERRQAMSERGKKGPAVRWKGHKKKARRK